MRIWKLSHGKDIRDDWYNDALNKNFVMVHEDTLSKGQNTISQGDNFTKYVNEGDVFYLCRGNSSIVLIGCFKGECNIDKDGWAYRKYDILFKAKNNKGYSGNSHWWTPNNNSTFIEINQKDQPVFETEILKPFFGVDLLDLENKLSVSRKMESYKKLLESNHNLILTGAPGTGKTYLAKEIAKAMGCSDEEIGFVQFHPSYDYTDFVEGLRPIQDDNTGAIGFERKDGVFKAFCERALRCLTGNQQISNFDNVYNAFVNDIIENGNNIELETPIQKRKFNVKINNNGKLVAIPQTGTGTEITITKEMLQIYIESDKITDWKSYVTSIVPYMKLKYGEMLSEKTPNKDAKFVFIIDEINRGEISKIFGELFYAIDPGYRGSEKCSNLRTQYANLQRIPNEFDSFLNIKDSDNYGHFFVPENVYIIGTMNDIDRSVESMDFAFRRRFAFNEIKAEENIGMLDNLDSSIKEDAIKRMSRLNKAIEETEGLSSAYHIGASYFLKLKNYNNDFGQLWDYHIEGLLREYLRGYPNIEDSLNKLKSAYDNENQNDSSDNN